MARITAYAVAAHISYRRITYLSMAIFAALC